MHKLYLRRISDSQEEEKTVEENKLYYDNDLRIWRVRGEPPPMVAPPVGPPPALQQSPAKPSPGLSSDRFLTTLSQIWGSRPYNLG